jgi:tetratricopeptide (TPR) repeat protein/GNAT superfamily N-acetyltransferase
MSFNINNHFISSKRKVEESSSHFSSKKTKPSSFLTNSSNTEQESSSFYSQYLNTFAHRPSSKEYERFLQNRAVEQYLARDLEGAVKTCNEILVKKPDSFLAKRIRGEIYYQQQRYQEAIEDLKNAFQAHPFEFESDRKFMVDACLKQGDDKTALKMLNYSLRRSPQNVSLLFLRAKLYLRKGEYNLINHDLNKIENNLAKLSNEIQIEYYLLKGELSLKIGKLDEAKDSFKCILTIDPSHLAALEKCLTIILKKGGEAEKINKYLTQIKAHHPHLRIWHDFAAARSSFMKAIEKKPVDYRELGQAEQLCIQCLNKDPKNQCFLCLYALVLYHLCDYDKAKKAFYSILKDYPNDPHTLAYLGFIDQNLGHCDSALEYFNQTLKIDDSREEVRKQRAKIYFDKKEYQLAHDDYQLLIERDFRSFAFNYGLTLAKLGKSESALDYLYFAFQMDSKNKMIQSCIIDISERMIRHHSQDQMKYLKSLYCLSMIYLENKRFNEAMQRLNLILSIDPNYFPARYAKSVCLFKMGHCSEAMANFYSSLKDHISASHFSLSSEDEKIMTAALEKKGVILRPFQFEDIVRLADFYDNLIIASLFNTYNLKELNEMASTQGPNENETFSEEIVSLQVPHSAKIKGCIFFNFKISLEEKKECHIRALYTAENYQNIGFGSLLLNYAIHRAIKKECDLVKLSSTQEGLPLYLSYGFKPVTLNPDELQQWEKCDIQEKMRFFANEELVDLILDLKDPLILSNVEQKLQKALSQPFVSKI